MASGPTITAKFVADTKDLTGDVEKATGKAGSSMDSFAKNAALAVGGAFAIHEVVDFGKQVVDMASSVSESMSKIGVVFGDQGDSVIKWSENSAKAMGLSQAQALEAAGTYGNLAVAIGLPQDKAADMSKSLVGLAADLASFNNVPVDDALKALQSGLTGETEPLKKFGVNMNETALKAKALSMGLIKAQVDTGKLADAQNKVESTNKKYAAAVKEHGANSEEAQAALQAQEKAERALAKVMEGKVPASLDAATKAQAAYGLIMEQTGTAQGDFARTSDGLANQQRIAAAEFDNLKATIGAQLLPVMTTLVTFLSTSLLPAFETVFGWLMDNKEVVVAAIVGIGAVMLPMFISWAAAAAVAAAATIAAAAPFIAIGVAIAALAYVVIHNWDTIVAVTTAAFDAVVGAVKTAFNWIKDNWPLLLAIITGPIGGAVLLIQRNWDTIKAGASAVWQWVVDKWNAIGSGISSVVSTIGGYMSTLVGYLRRPIDAATDVYNWIHDKFQGVVDFLYNITFTIGRIVGDIARAIKDPINAVIRAWNALEFKIPTINLPRVHVPGTNVDVGGGTFGGQTIGFPDLPQLGRGGVLTSPTAFIGGEAGTEIVAPEELLRQIIHDESRGGHYVLNMYPRTADPADVAYGFQRLELMAGIR